MNSARFKIVVPSFNNQDWVEHNVASILNQTYHNYEVLYINDASTDDTLNTVLDLVEGLENWRVVSNQYNMRRGYNISPYNKYILDFVNYNEDILVFVDGDDWLFDDSVLQKLNDFYNQRNCWMTYGGMVCYPSQLEAYPQNTEYSNYVHESNAYRLDFWRASHLRSFKWGLYKKIKEESMLYSKTGKYYFHAEDLATSYPCLEMCPKERIGVLDFHSYVFNETPSNRKRGQEREEQAGADLEIEIRGQRPYSEIQNYE